MRGSVTLDFMMSLALLLATTPAFLFLSYTQMENTLVVSAQMKAEAMAMATGSAINHFAAVQPGEGSEMTLKFLPIEGLGAGVQISPSDCRVLVNGTDNTVTVSVLVSRMESSRPERVSASYPVTDVYADAGYIIAQCDGEMGFSPMDGGVIKVTT